MKSPLKLKKQLNKNIKKNQTLTVSEEACGQISFPISVGDDFNVHCLGEVCADLILKFKLKKAFEKMINSVIFFRLFPIEQRSTKRI